MLLCLLLCFACCAEEKVIPRTLIALYKTQDEPNPYQGNLSLYAEMPLNHLGLKLEYHNIDENLPSITQRKDVRGVITWFDSGDSIKNPVEYLEWLSEVVTSGKKVLIIGSPIFTYFPDKRPVAMAIVNRFWRRLGLKVGESWIGETYKAKFIAKKNIIGFERELPEIKPGFPLMEKVSDDIESLLKVETEKGEGVLISCSSAGGYIAEYYACNKDAATPQGLQWYINPFEYFKKVFETEGEPKPDVTTVAGRRIYFSHIDGDGWNNRTLIEKYKEAPPISAKIVLDYAIRPYPDLPVSIGPIAADIDLSWYGLKESRHVAEELFKLDQVEIGSHTYTHPYRWGFFKDGDLIKKEEKFKKQYQVRDEKGIRKWMNTFLRKRSKYIAIGEGGLNETYDIPRAYGKEPFDLKKEIVGSFRLIDGLVPPGKKEKILMWSGDTTPFEEALKICREGGYKNINGGDSRFDDVFPSYLWLAPVGRQVGKERQIYAVCSNENTYTDLWEKNHHGFKYLTRTLENTEHPFRIKPINIYYHMYSGERTSSINALIHNLEYARFSEIAPITASQYCGIAEGFYSTQFVTLEKDKWQVINRGELQTIRFDSTIFKGVDFSASVGVVGQRHFQGSLYVYLDSTVNKPIIKLKGIECSYKEPEENVPYLIHSRWMVKNFSVKDGHFSFSAKGFGKGAFNWSVPKDGEYSVSYGNKSIRAVGLNGNLIFVLPIEPVKWVNVTVQPIEGKE